MELLRALQLQPVLHTPQELVGLRKLVKLFATDVPFIMQFLQRKKCATGPQPSFFPAINTLKALGEEFDIPNASTIQFHIDRFRMFSDCHQPAPARSHSLA